MSKTVSGTTTDFAWNTTGSVPLLIAAGTTYYLYGPGGQPIEQLTGTTPSYLLADQSGSTRLITSPAGAVTGTYTYGPYGTVAKHTGTATTALQYDGQYTDAESGLQYLQARYYDPVDRPVPDAGPAGVAHRPAIQEFGGDNPLNTLDPIRVVLVQPCDLDERTGLGDAGDGRCGSRTGRGRGGGVHGIGGMRRGCRGSFGVATLEGGLAFAEVTGATASTVAIGSILVGRR